MDYPSFNARFAVPRETFEKLSAYHDLLLLWQKKINLISPKTIDEIWERHILDSCQFASLIVPRETSIMDIGTGAGLPGLILAILGFQSITLIDSDQKKCVFLQEASAKLDLNVTILSQRVEQVKDKKTAVILSRALAPLHQLLAWSSPLLSPSGKCLFAKGENYAKEIEEALATWQFDVKVHPSITHADAKLLEISQLTKR